MTEEERVAQLTEGMRFARKTPLSPAEKAAYTALEASSGEAMHALQKLHLRLWHAAQGNYRALSMSDACKLLAEVRAKIDAALEMCPKSGDEA